MVKYLFRVIRLLTVSIIRDMGYLKGLVEGRNRSSGRFPAFKHVILLDKPKGISSRAACEEVKRKVGAKKAGDTGTLDDNTTGLLIVCLDEATKAVLLLMGLDKEYVTTINLHNAVETEKIKEALRYFTGEVKQLPPVRSAVARKERIRKVYSIEVLKIEGRDITLRLKCQAGFYVRKFAHDLGQVLGCGAQMVALRRAAVGNITEAMCVKMEDVSREKTMSLEHLLRLVRAKKVFVLENALNNVRHGIGLMSYHLDGMDKDIGVGDPVAIFHKKDVLAVGKAVKDARHYFSHRKRKKAYQYILPDRVLNF